MVILWLSTVNILHISPFKNFVSLLKLIQVELSHKHSMFPLSCFTPPSVTLLILDIRRPSLCFYCTFLESFLSGIVVLHVTLPWQRNTFLLSLLSLHYVYFFLKWFPYAILCNSRLSQTFNWYYKTEVFRLLIWSVKTFSSKT